MNTLLTPELLANVGNVEPGRLELVTRKDIRKYSIATGQKLRKFLDGDVAPPMFHIALFWDIAELDELTPDGVFIDKLVPELPLKRAMAGGVKIEYNRAIFPGDVLKATRVFSDLYEKQGSTGPLIFYVITTRVETSSGEWVLTETNTRIMR